ncbi:DNA polymerase III subunit delta [Aquamicrobium sp. LC103]|uniref:DNA polymerase III subunit delta n=1 Tax=Aquamicrobium sp. LC103 TaxID=1120658 RepID=UPI00063E9FE8|nr:DNA polymerase III subunit delta [Aquamicrobium sp. LC103]TKT82814.1 DNA polymerase III subunit delta [Aquamicrobium sp. LC103]
MAQKKAHEVDGWLRRPDPYYRVILIYGPDRGLVSERARLVARQSGLSVDDPFSVVRLDASDVDAMPGRLLDEAGTVPMFSDRRLVWVKGAAAQKALADDVKVLLAQPPAETTVLIEAGDLKKGASLRSMVEGAAQGIALPCYADDGRSIDAIIDEELSREGLTITLDARQALRANLGGDRLATRGEVEKLALYCRGKGRIEIEDVRATAGDVSAVSVDNAVDAVLAGKAGDFDVAFAQLMASGNHPFLVLSGAMRQFQSLQLMRADMEKTSRTAAAVVASARPPVFFSRRKLVEDALARWSPPALARALDRLQGAVLLTRRRPDLAEATARQALIALVVESARSRR